MQDIVKVNCSGGKDSTAAELLHLREGHHTKVVNYIPMLTKDIPLITKRHYEFIQVLLDRFEKMGAEIYRAKGMTYYDFCTHIVKTGNRKGLMFGFPCYIPQKCDFKGYSKVKSLEKIDCGKYDYEDIGIAFDEVGRQNQLTETKRSILVEKEITEEMAFDICKKTICFLLTMQMTREMGVHFALTEVQKGESNGLQIIRKHSI